MRPLAEVARDAPDADWMERSFARSRSGGPRQCLLRSTGWCMAYAGECLSHAFDETRGYNSRFVQDDFTFRFVLPTADAWGDYLDAGGDANVCEWSDAPLVITPGDMLFWRAGVRGYRYRAGHVAIVVDTTPHVVVSENSSSRGIGVHRIDKDALDTVAGSARWQLPPTRQYDDWAAPAVEWCKEKGIMTGRGDGFAGRQPITRQEVAVVLHRLHRLIAEENN